MRKDQNSAGVNKRVKLHGRQGPSEYEKEHLIRGVVSLAPVIIILASL